MRTPAVLITGASGEIGHGLISRLAAENGRAIVALDLAPLDSRQAALVDREVIGSVLDRALLDRLLAEFEIDRIFHLAALLSTRSEFSPIAAYEVNVGGTLNLLELAQREAESHGRPVTFLYPSSIAVYGLPSADVRRSAGPVREDQWTQPATIYGCTKVACEQLGHYYARHYKQLAAGEWSGRVDFRGLRFPGLLSAVTTPSGGTSDYASEMLHAAARGRPYACFVRPDTRLPFMVMPDAVDALIRLADAPRASLAQTVYNVRAFAASADDIRSAVLTAFPGASVAYAVDERRQRIVDSWPEDVDDAAARRDWGWSAAHDFTAAFDRYLVPTLTQS